MRVSGRLLITITKEGKEGNGSKGKEGEGRGEGARIKDKRITKRRFGCVCVLLASVAPSLEGCVG